MANIKTTTKFSRFLDSRFVELKMIIIYLFSHVFKCLFTIRKKKLLSFIVKKIFIEIGFKEGCFKTFF